MQQLHLKDLQVLFDEQEGPCLSLYQSTHRSHPENEQDPIRYKNLLKQLEKSLADTYPSKEYEPLLKPFHDLDENVNFWQHTLDGIAILSNKDHFHVFHLLMFLHI